MANFSTAIPLLLAREGGYVKDPDDHGGATKYGISQRAYPLLNIRLLTQQDAIDIYAADYWGPLRCDEIISQKVASILFDFGVNAGLPRAIKTLQASIGVPVDGIIGPITLGAINEKINHPGGAEIVAMRYTICRIAFYGALASRRKSQRKFLPGWITRALDALND